MLGFDFDALDFDLYGLAATTRYVRSPSAFSHVSVNPSFLRTTPAKKPRTECRCQSVAFMMAAIVAPWGRLSNVSTASCLVPPRIGRDEMFPNLVELFVRACA